MTGLRAWIRLEVRTRWRSLVVLALLIAFATGTVMTAVAGARRGATSVDRLLARTLPTTALVLPNQPGFDWAPVRELPEVAALTEFVVGGVTVVDPPDHDPDGVSFPPADDEVWRTIERPVVLDGRVPEASREDEVAVTARFRSDLGRGVGDTVTLRLPTPEQVDAAAGDGEEEPPAGPTIVATIVGVLRSPWFSDNAESSDGAVILSPGIAARHLPNLIGAQGSGYINAQVRLRHGAADIPAFKAGLARVSGRDDIDSQDMGESYDHGREVTGFEAESLYAFALAAAVAAVFLIGQAVTRYAGAALLDLDTFRAVGFTPAQARLGASLGPVTAAVAGSVAGGAIAVFASRWFPIGTAAFLEPDPGTSVDWLTLGIGLLAVPLLVAGAAVAVASVAPARRESGGGRRRRLADALSGGPVPLAVGTRYALDPGRGRRAVPVRPALLGALVGVAGVVGALTFSSGVADATDGFERFGQTYDFGSFSGINGVEFGPTKELLRAVADDPEVSGAIDARMEVAQGADDVSVSVYAYDTIGQPIPQVVTKGRMPQVEGEVALAPRTADALHASVGDHIALTGTKGPLTVTVTGEAFVPSGPHNGYASGAWTLPATYDRLFDGFKFRFGLIAGREGADLDALAARISDVLGADVARGPIIPPSELVELQEVDLLPRLLAVFLALLAVGAVGHALATTVRRRRHDLAVLRSLGITRGATRMVVATQSLVIAVIGFVIGIPLGVALGRTIWRAVAERTPVAHVAPTDWLAVVLAAPVAVLFAAALAAWPAHRAARLRLGEALRTE